MKINKMNQNCNNNSAFQSRLSPAVNEFIERKMAGLAGAKDKFFLSEYRKIVINLKKDIESINPFEYGIIDKQGDYFIYKGYKTEEKMEKMIGLLIM